MIIEEAIRAAAENGYGYRYYKANELGHLEGYNGLPFREIEQHVLDPDFWRCLGKAKGWEDHHCLGCKRVYPEYVNGCVYHEHEVNGSRSVRPDPHFRYHQYRMIDHRADGGTINSYFQDL